MLNFTIHNWLALFVATVATDSAVFVATFPVSLSLLFNVHFLACSVCSQQ